MVEFPIKVDLPNINAALVKMEAIKSSSSMKILYFETQYCSKDEGRIVLAEGEVFNKNC